MHRFEITEEREREIIESLWLHVQGFEHLEIEALHIAALLEGVASEPRAPLDELRAQALRLCAAAAGPSEEASEDAAPAGVRHG